jgi:hypothetical protein
MTSNLKDGLDKHEEVSLKELILKIRKFWRYLLTKFVVILLAGVIGGAIGFAYSYFKKPVYVARLSFALEDEKNSSLGGAAGLASQFGFDLGGGGGGAFSGDNLLELMKSRSMVEKALLTTIDVGAKKETLVEFYISYNKFREKWANNPKLKSISFLPNTDRAGFSMQQDSILGTFYQSIVTGGLVVDKIDKKLSIINLSFSSENEIFSKRFVEILAKTVSDFYVDTKTKKTVQTVILLQHQTDSVRKELNNAINGVASSYDNVPNANPGRQLLRAPSQHKQVDVEANKAIFTELVKNLEASKV